MEKEYITVNRNAYNVFAKQHNERQLKEEYWNKLLKEEFLTPNKKNKVLEIGPGTGKMLKILEDLNCETTAVELSEEMIKFAKERAPKTKFIQDDILNVSFPDNIFDGILMGALIHNFPKEDANKLMKLVFNWIKPKGKVLIYTTIHDKSEEGYFEKQDYEGNIIRFRKKFTEEEFQKLIEENNYIIKDKIYDEEKDRNKKWITYIIEKNNDK